MLHCCVVVGMTTTSEPEALNNNSMMSLFGMLQRALQSAKCPPLHGVYRQLISWCVPVISVW